jgi:hypothetical protein
MGIKIDRGDNTYASEYRLGKLLESSGRRGNMRLKQVAVVPEWFNVLKTIYCDVKFSGSVQRIIKGKRLLPIRYELRLKK